MAESFRFFKTLNPREPGIAVDILVVTNKTEEIVDLFGDKVVVISENEYVPPVMKIGKVYAAAQVKLVNTAWWDDLRFRSVDKAINLL